MILVFIFLSLIILLFLEIIILMLSTLKVKVINLNFGDNFGNFGDTHRIYKIKISIEILKRFPILWVNLDNKKIEKIKNKINEINLNKFKDKFKSDITSKEKVISALKRLKVYIKEFDLMFAFGLEDIFATTYIAIFLGSLTSILLSKAEIENISKCKYLIEPIYNNKNEYHLTFNGIFCIKIVHIICSILKLIEKGSNEKNERTSNRRSYAYRYE